MRAMTFAAAGRLAPTLVLAVALAGCIGGDPQGGAGATPTRAGSPTAAAVAPTAPRATAPRATATPPAAASLCAAEDAAAAAVAALDQAEAAGDDAALAAARANAAAALEQLLDHSPGTAGGLVAAHLDAVRGGQPVDPEDHAQLRALLSSGWFCAQASGTGADATTRPDATTGPDVTTEPGTSTPAGGDCDRFPCPGHAEDPAAAVERLRDTWLEGDRAAAAEVADDAAIDALFALEPTDAAVDCPQAGDCRLVVGQRTLTVELSGGPERGWRVGGVR